MAIGGTPVGNMVIKVDLDSAGVEKSMTGLQRQLRSSNKAMGAQLSAFDRGDRSAAKYGVMIEGLTNRHRLQGRMVDEARAKYNHMSETYGENSVKAQQASQELNEQIARYQETGRELDNVTAEFQEFQRVQEMQSQGWYKVADGMENMGGKLKDAGTAMDNTGRKMTKGVTVPLGIVGGLAVKVGSDFEAGMSKVGAVSGASAEDMERLEVKAREMGATTVFSATEASEAMYYMSLAGWDAQESIDGIDGVMDLAAASGEDLGRVADIVTDGLTAFGMSAEDSGRMADVLAAASANANTDVSGLGAAFQYVAPIAGALGYSMEDTSKAIGLMSNSGIKAQKAGTALRKMMNSISSPTGEAKDLMKEYGISLTDSEGNMKSFDGVMKDLRKGLGGLSEEQQAQAASTIFGQEAMSGALAIVNASEEDYKKLTESIEGSEGAASEMADTMQDNLQGSLKELKSMLEDLFIEMYQNLKPALESVIDGAKSLTQWFADLSPETQENIVKFGLLAAAMGPVLSVTGKLTFGLGGLMQGAGALTKTIGMSKGAGLLGALGGLGPAAVPALAVAGLAGVAYGAKKLYDRSKEVEEVNLDVANSLNDQAVELEKSANTFDELSAKAKISNTELAELNDLNIRIAESSNPAEIEQLQKQYDELAKNSGLSKDELKELFGANENIIEQSPNVEQSISDQGNAFAKNTEAVREYIESLHEATLIELDAERQKNAENEVKLKKQLKEEQNELNGLLDQMSVTNEASKLSEEERVERLQELPDLIQEAVNNGEDSKNLTDEQNALIALQKEEYGELVDGIKTEIEEKRKSINNTEEELGLIKELEMEAANIVLQQVGINEEGEKGLAQLDKSIAKNDEELEKLNEKLKKNGELTEEEQQRYTELSNSTDKQREARDYLHDELGLYQDINSLAEGKLENADKETQKKIESLTATTDIKAEEGNIVEQLQNKNSEYDKEIEKLQKQKEEQGANKKEINKQIDGLKGKKKWNDSIIEQVLKELGIWDDVKRSIDKGTESEKKKSKEVSGTLGKLREQSDTIGASNKLTKYGTGLEKNRTKEAGKSVDKKVTAKDHGTVARIDRFATAGKSKKVSLRSVGLSALNRGASAAKTKNVHLKAIGLSDLNRSVSAAVTKRVNMVGSFGGSLTKHYASGTPPGGHQKDGPAIVGEKGRELINLPTGQSFLSPGTDTMLPLPKGTHVIPHRETNRLLKAIPKYADGTSGWTNAIRNNEFMRLLALTSRDSKMTVDVNESSRSRNKENTYIKDLLNATLEQNQILMKILAKNPNMYMDGELIGKGVSGTIDKEQSNNVDIKMLMKGLM